MSYLFLSHCLPYVETQFENQKGWVLFGYLSFKIFPNFKGKELGKKGTTTFIENPTWK